MALEHCVLPILTDDTVILTQNSAKNGQISLTFQYRVMELRTRIRHQDIIDFIDRCEQDIFSGEVDSNNNQFPNILFRCKQYKLHQHFTAIHSTFPNCCSSLSTSFTLLTFVLLILILHTLNIALLKCLMLHPVMLTLMDITWKKDEWRP